MTMHYITSSSRTYSSELEFTEHALGHILKRASPYAVRRRSDDDDSPLLDELNYTGYIQIKQLVHKTFPKCNISQIFQVYAPQMYGMYMLSHEEMKLTVGQRVQEKLLYRVTTESNAMKLLNSGGLDWRRTKKLDCGVSFSDDADYANFYDESLISGEMYVLPKNIKEKISNVPPGRADTTIDTEHSVTRVTGERTRLEAHSAKFGCGVSFSDDADYANYYANRVLHAKQFCAMTMYSPSGSSSSRIHTSTSEFTKHAEVDILEYSSRFALLPNSVAVRPLLNELNNKGYSTIKQIVNRTFPNCYINGIRLVHAPQMYGMYMLREEEMKLAVGREVQEKLMFHVTTESRAMEILDCGLDWRRTHRNKFGCGVSFSDDADYANYYADNSSREETLVIMICTVLISKTFVVPRQYDGSSLIVPPGGADTTVSDNSHVYVKYNDNEFYPLYFVYYRKRQEYLTQSKYFRDNTRRAMAAGHYDRRTTEEICSDHLDATGYYDDDDTLEQMCSDFNDREDDYSNELYGDDLYADYFDD